MDHDLGLTDLTHPAPVQRTPGGRVHRRQTPRDLYVDIGWKEHAVLRLAEQFPDAKLAWIDDTAVPESFSTGSATRRLPQALLIAPNSAKGLQMEQIVAIEEYFGPLGTETP